MNPIENLHYAIGEIAYAIAKADGNIQKKEHEKFQAIVAAELRSKDYNFDIADIIFKLLEKDRPDSETAFNWAMEQIKLNSHYLSPELKTTFIRVADKIAKAFPPIVDSEKSLLTRFLNAIEPIHGDPVYYKSRSNHPSPLE